MAITKKKLRALLIAYSFRFIFVAMAMAMATAMVKFKLNSGTSIPGIGLGMGQRTDDIVDAILSAIQVGYRHFDTAADYNTESYLGEALTKAFRTGLVKREEVFVTTKLKLADNYPSGVLPALRKSLSALQLDYLDLYLVHWPLRLNKEVVGRWPTGTEVCPMDHKGVWQEMEECVSAGLVKAIGVSNWTVKKLEDLLAHAKIPPAVNQVEVHPLWRQDRLREYCKRNGIHMSAYAPLGAPGSSYGSADVTTIPVVKDIAHRLGKTPAQVILRWDLEKGVSAIPRSYNKGRQAENFDILTWALSDEDISRIDSIPEQKKILDAKSLVDPVVGYYKSVEELWDGEI